MPMSEKVEEQDTSLCPCNVFLEPPFSSLAGKLALSTILSAAEQDSILLSQVNKEINFEHTLVQSQTPPGGHEQRVEMVCSDPCIVAGCEVSFPPMLVLKLRA